MIIGILSILLVLVMPLVLERSQQIANAMIRFSASCLPSDKRKERCEQWLADSLAIEGQAWTLFNALACVWMCRDSIVVRVYRQATARLSSRKENGTNNRDYRGELPHAEESSELQQMAVSRERIYTMTEEVLRLLQEQSFEEYDPLAKETMLQAMGRLVVAQDSKRKAAAAHLLSDPPDPQRALLELKHLAAHQNDCVAESAIKAAETYREIAALTYYTDEQEAVRALEKVLSYAPNDTESRRHLDILLTRLGRI